MAGARRAHELIEAVAAPAAADGLAAALDAGSMSRAQLYGEYQAAAEALAAAKADKEAMGETLHRVLAELDAKARAAGVGRRPDEGGRPDSLCPGGAGRAPDRDAVHREGRHRVVGCDGGNFLWR